MTKRLFWSIFKPAWDQGVRKETIQSGFAKTGIYPLNPSIVLDQVQPIVLSSSSDEQEHPKTVRNAMETRKLTKIVRRELPNRSSNIDLLIQSLEEMQIENELLRHENVALRNTLISEKRRQKKGKPLGLVPEGEEKHAQFWSPIKLQAQILRLNEAQEQTQQAKRFKEEQKLQQQTEREERQRLYREGVETRKKEREQKKAKQEAEKVFKRRERELNQAIKATQKEVIKTPSTIKQT